MNKQNNNLDEKELLKKVEDLIDGKTINQKITNSFLGFCSRLFSVRPKTDDAFQLSLKRELLKKHPAYFEKKVDFRQNNKIKNSLIIIKEYISMKKTKLALIGVPATLVIALAIIFTSVISPTLQTVRAMDIVANDPQVREVIEQYNLDVQEVITKGNTAYIVLNTVDDATYIMGVDLESSKVKEIVKEKGEKDIKKTEALEQKAVAIGMSLEEFKSYLKEQYEAKAESKGMSVEEFKNDLENQKKEYYRNFNAEAEAKGMTEEEYKEYLGNQKK